MSIAMIGVCTAVIGDVAGHLGCFIYLKDSVNAIAFVALGTSVPGTILVIKMKKKSFCSRNCVLAFCAFLFLLHQINEKLLFIQERMFNKRVCF